MRVRKRYAVMLAIAAMIGAVITYQAVTATPPEPYVRLVGDGRPNAPWSREECRSGLIYSIYTTSDGRELPATTRGVSCLERRRTLALDERRD